MARGVKGRLQARPLTFVQAAAFQSVNPKAGAMALGAASGLYIVSLWPAVTPEM